MKKLLGLILVCAMMIGCGGLFAGCNSGESTVENEIESEKDKMLRDAILKFVKDHGRTPTASEKKEIAEELVREYYRRGLM